MGEPIAKSREADLPEVTPAETDDEETTETEVTSQGTTVTAEVPTQASGETPSLPGSSLPVQNETTTAAPQEEPSVTDLPEVTPVEAQKEETAEVKVTPDVASQQNAVEESQIQEPEEIIQGDDLVEIETVKDETESTAPMGEPIAKSREADLPEVTPAETDDEETTETEVTFQGTTVTAEVPTQASGETPLLPGSSLPVQNKTATAAPQEEPRVTDLPEVTPVEAQKEETAEVKVTPDVASQQNAVEESQIQAPEEIIQGDDLVEKETVKDEIESTAPVGEPIAKSREADLPKVTPAETDDEETTETEVISQGTTVTVEVPTQASGETPSLPESSLPVQNETATAAPQEEPRVTDLPEVTPVEAQKETVEVEVTSDVASPPVKDETESTAPMGEPIAKSREADLPEVTPAETDDEETTETEVTSQGTTVTAEVPTQASGETPSLPESSLPVQNETETAPPVTEPAVVSHENGLPEESVIIHDEEDIAVAEVTPEFGESIAPVGELTAKSCETDLSNVTPTETHKEETIETEMTIRETVIGEVREQGVKKTGKRRTWATKLMKKIEEKKLKKMEEEKRKRREEEKKKIEETKREEKMKRREEEKKREVEEKRRMEEEKKKIREVKRKKIEEEKRLRTQRFLDKDMSNTAQRPKKGIRLKPKPKLEVLRDGTYFGFQRNFYQKYEIIQKLGQGYFGHTCLARDIEASNKYDLVAVKILTKAEVKYSS
ncbi:hypothetical protein R1sor_027024 [Riccia sorocarpa]|uniref:Protein kinase domain-containing protein n=1 Tax=Riccia sorocarpa TaxID=122646 RepID=A0ABD3GEJ7_9MARC